jgi:hypothetical protein
MRAAGRLYIPYGIWGWHGATPAPAPIRPHIPAFILTLPVLVAIYIVHMGCVGVVSVAWTAAVHEGETRGGAGDQLRSQRGQRAWYWPPRTPWVHWGAGMGCVGSWGRKLAAGPAGWAGFLSP